jgi:hypothetical protein
MRRWTLIAVAVLVVLRLVAEVTPFLRRPDLALFDTWQSLRGHHPSSQIVIVGIDEKSIARIGPAPWPRNEFVPLVQRLSKAGAKVIGFDYTFGTLEREAANNRVLAEASAMEDIHVTGDAVQMSVCDIPTSPSGEVLLESLRAPQWVWLLEWGLFLALCGLGVWLLGLVVALRLTASEKETRDVGAEKLAAEKKLALSFQEKGLLDMALAQSNKVPFTQDMKALYLNLGPDYENRGLPQKAYLVYRKIFDADRLPLSSMPTKPLEQRLRGS